MKMLKIKKKSSKSNKRRLPSKDKELSDNEQDQNDVLELLDKKVSNESGDSSDDEGIENYTSDESDDLEFESDEEGNYKRKEANLAHDKEDGQEEEEEEEDESEEEEDDDLNILGKTGSEQSVNDSNYSDDSGEENVHESDVYVERGNVPKRSSEDTGEIRSFTGNVRYYDEYENSDTSDEEDIRNTIGNIPKHWYDEYKHMGYDWDAKQIIKPAQGDQIDDFLRKIEDPNFWRTVKDPQTGQEVVLSEEDIGLIRRINSGRIPDSSYNSYEPWVEWFSSEVEKMPITNVPDHKRSFLPSVPEKKKIGKMVHALKMGWMKTMDDLKKERDAKKGPKFYMLWESDTGREDMRRIHDPVSAPKRDLPGHAESYNPPSEYLLDDKEMKEWNKLAEEPHKRKLHFLPQKHKTLRDVPAYSRYMRERFLRCLDLYLCPRAKRMKLNIDAEYLVPKLPSPRDLQPFPTVESLVYNGHTDLVRSISIEPKGEYLVSGSDDKTVKIWEVATARCIRTIDTMDVVRSVAWCPNPKLSMIAIASGQQLMLINPKVGDKVLTKKTDDLLSEPPKSEQLEAERILAAVQWETAGKREQIEGVRIIIKHFKVIKQVTWHGRGDYFATVMPEGANRSVLIHQLSKRRSQIPFSKSKGLIQCALFHPVKPCLFVATQHNIRIYDLMKQELIKKLITNSKWISGMAIHPKGDNLLVSTYDKKMLWFDLDLSTKPYQTMRLHKSAVRSVAYHLRYPLFASASDDTSVIVSHGMVYNDLLQNPLIVPLKKLETHEQREELGVLDVIWHPYQPWVFSSGADSTIRLFT